MRRKKEGKTDYKARRKMLESERPRIIIRRTNRYIIVQYVESEEAKDKIIFGVNSKKLLDYGWKEEDKGKLKNIQAAYLTGYLFGKMLKDKELDENAIVDLGLARTLFKSRIYTSIRGIIDSGIKIKAEIEIDEGKIKSEEITKIKLNIQNKIK